MTLCNQCRAITAPSLISAEGYLLHNDLHALHDYASACDLCNLVLTYFRASIEACFIELTRKRTQNTLLLAIKQLLDTASRSSQVSDCSYSSLPIILRHRQDSLPHNKQAVVRSTLHLRRDPTQTSSINVSFGYIADIHTSQYAHGKNRNVIWSITWSTEPCLEFRIVTHIPVYTYLGDGLQWLGVQVRDNLAPSSIDPMVMFKVKKWIKHCMATHSECHSIHVGPDQCPKRLIDLQTWDQNKSYQIVDTPANFQDEYVALSYCWGEVTKSWIEYLQRVQSRTIKRFEYEPVPHTIRDAIRICLALGYTYLWVDCLCIIQGDASDWLQESARMEKIFANAVLVISASGAANCTDGFLQPRSQLQQNGVILPLTLEEDFGSATTSNLHLCLPGDGFENIVGLGPVTGRAWCLQERQLARRVLHVCQSEVFFECILSRHSENESTPCNEFEINSQYHLVHIPTFKYRFDVAKPSAGARSVILWYATVEDYTLRSLTDGGDKLIAISGLAKRAHVDLGGAYLAGLWERQLHIGLAWMIEKNSSATRAATYRAPSWSWASIEGPVSWQLIDGYVQNDSGFLDSAIALLHSSIDLVSHDFFGPIKNAEICLCGSLLLIPAERLLHNEILTYPAWMSGKYPGVIGWYMEDEKNVIEDDKIVCLKIATRPFGPGPSLPPTNEMLILKRVGTRATSKSENMVSAGKIGVYRRVGFGQVKVTNYFDNVEMENIVLI